METPITHYDLVQKLAKSDNAIRMELTSLDCHLLHMAVGFAGEIVGELIPTIMNVVRGAAFDRENAIEELGDAEFYLRGLYQGLTITEFDVAEINNIAATIVLPQDQPEYRLAAKVYLVTALASSSGELLDYVKRLTIYRKDPGQLVLFHTLASIEFFLGLVYTELQITRQEALDGNIAKLSKRYASMSYSDQQAVARADKVEVSDGR
jgi:hypothetical protein